MAPLQHLVAVLESGQTITAQSQMLCIGPQAAKNAARAQRRKPLQASFALVGGLG
jgi:hypothetical protein